jgi:multiple sugar transport system substrate-binding protein
VTMGHGDREVTAKGVTRRTFLAGIPAAAASLTLAAHGAHAALKAGTKVHLLRGSSYVRDEDKWFAEYLRDNWAKPNNVELIVETVNPGDMTAKISVALETGVGPDIIRLAWDQPLLYAPKLMDVGAIAEKQGADGGGYFDSMKAFCSDRGVWRALPFGMVGNAVIYRGDWLKELGESRFPDTWEEYNRVGKLMKSKKSAPTGQAIAHSTGDPRHGLYPLLWAFGGKEVLEDGKTVAINSKETVACLEFFAQWFKDSLSPEMLGWDDNGNNRAYLGEQIWATNNAASLYLEARAKFPKIAEVTFLAPNPRGPAGRFHTAGPHSHCIPTYVKDPAPAKDLLAFLARPQVFSDFMLASKGYTSPAVKMHAKHPIWDADPKMALYRDVSAYKWPGYPAPPSAKSGEVVNKFIIIDMFAKVAQGSTPKQAIEWTESQLARIYGKS